MPLGWVPTDGPFVPVGEKGDSSLDAAVVKPGVAYEKTEAKDVMPPQAPPDGIAVSYTHLRAHET